MSAPVVSVLRPPRRLATWLAASALGLALSACGPAPEDQTNLLQCSVTQQKSQLRSYMRDWYLWADTSPDPYPLDYSTLPSYFQAMLYTGGQPGFPYADGWSYITSTADYNQFFDEGRTLGYGLMVNGLEVGGQPALALRVRYVEPNSPAAWAGIQRGDQITSLNGVPAASWVAADDFSPLTATAQNQLLTVGLQNASGSRTVQLAATTYSLQPVVNAQVITTPGGRKVGTLLVKDMVDAALPGLASAFSLFRSQNVQDLVIDLRYNGGGRVSVGAALASYVSYALKDYEYANLLFNARHADSDRTFYFAPTAASLALSRVYVLSGPRTCSAAEQVINGLAPFVPVYQIGDTTCGKPVGFTPWDDGCGSTYSAVTFESVNANYEGRYFDGLAPTCTVAEDWSAALGSSTEPLLAAALAHVDTGACPSSAAPTASAARVLGTQRQAASLVRNALGQPRRAGWSEPGQRIGMRP